MISKTIEQCLYYINWDGSKKHYKLNFIRTFIFDIIFNNYDATIQIRITSYYKKIYDENITIFINHFCFHVCNCFCVQRGDLSALKFRMCMSAVWTA